MALLFQTIKWNDFSIKNRDLKWKTNTTKFESIFNLNMLLTILDRYLTLSKLNLTSCSLKSNFMWVKSRFTWVSSNFVWFKSNFTCVKFDLYALPTNESLKWNFSHFDIFFVGYMCNKCCYCTSEIKEKCHGCCRWQNNEYVPFFRKCGVYQTTGASLQHQLSATCQMSREHRQL